MISLDAKWLHPTKEFTMDPKTLARHLGRVVRFGGCVDTYWSVLQHSLLVGDLARQQGFSSRIQLLGLMHDAHEFVTGDVPRPWKLPEVSAQQNFIDELLRVSMGLPVFTPEEHAIIKRIDDEALIIEAHLVARRVVHTKPEYFEDHAGLTKQYGSIFYKFCLFTPLLNFKACWEEDGMFVSVFSNVFQNLLHAVSTQPPV